MRLESDPALAAAVVASIRSVPDFPQAGIVFRDLTPLLCDHALFSRALDALAERFADAGVTRVAAIESRGFIFGAPVAERLGAGLVPVRKVGKLPHTTVRVAYELEYGEAVLEMHDDAIGRGDRVLVVDDVLATGGTAAAAIELAERCGGAIVGAAFVLEIAALEGHRRLGARPVVSLACV